MSSRNCQHCGCNEIDTDPARGDAVCTNCGSVLEDNIIVSEIQFEENSHGGARAIGQHVTSEGQTPGLSRGYPYGTGKESQMITLQNAKKRITQLSEQIRLNQRCIEFAYNIYKIVLAKRLTRGRKNSHVIAACIYIACRIEGTPHMLLDLSDVLQVNVYELGKTYLKFVSVLCLKFPELDPCLYIPRFAHQLEFGNKTHAVSTTAMRLVQRMKRDWMNTGRRPSGLCGAALLVAARLHDFNRTIKDIIKIVRVCEATVRKRLTEFSDTPTSQLTLDEFMNIDLEEEQDPPCFKEAKRKQKLQQLEENGFEEVSNKITEFQELIEKALEDKRKKLRGPYAKYCQFTPQEEQNNLSENDITQQFIVEETLESIQDFVGEDIINNKEENTYSYIPNHPSAAGLGLKESIEECVRKDPIDYEENNDGELDFMDLNEEEIDSYLMPEEDVISKTREWTKQNADYLREQKEKEEREAKEEEENSNKEQKKRKRFSRKRINANNAHDAMESMIRDKKLSRKINYEVLENLYTNDNKLNETEKEPEKPILKHSKSKSKVIPKGGQPSEKIKNVMSSIFQQRQKETFLPIDDDDEHLEKISKKEMEKKAVEESKLQEISEAPIILEEKIILRGEQLPEEELDESDLEEEEDEVHLSAAQLLEKHRGEELYYSGGDDDYYD